MFKYVIFFVCFLGLSFKSDCAIAPEDKEALIKAYAPLVAECSQAHGVSDDDITAAKEKESPEGITPCFFGCVFKKLDILNGEGKVDIPVGLSKLKEFIKSDDDYSKYEEIGKRCASVNDESVSDADAGCERAQLFLKCVTDNKAELSL